MFLLRWYLTAPCFKWRALFHFFPQSLWTWLAACIYFPVSHTCCLVGSTCDRDPYCTFVMHQQVADGIPHYDSQHMAGKISFLLHAGLPWSAAPMFCPGSGRVQWQAIVSSHNAQPWHNSSGKCSIISSCFSVCCQAESKWKVNNLCVAQVKWW